MVVCDGPTHGGSIPTKWDRSGSHPSAHTAPRPLVRQIREFVKAVHRAAGQEGMPEVSWVWGWEPFTSAFRDAINLGVGRSWRLAVADTPF